MGFSNEDAYTEEERWVKETRATIQSAGQVQTPQPSAIQDAHDVLVQASSLSSMCEELADTLLGHIETPAKGQDGGNINSGLLPTLQEHARAVANNISGAREALNRIRRALP
jgi:hypothetical protein